MGAKEHQPLTDEDRARKPLPPPAPPLANGSQMEEAIHEIEVALATVFPGSANPSFASNLPLEMRARLVAVELRSRGTWWIERSQRIEIERGHLGKDFEALRAENEKLKASAIAQYACSEGDTHGPKFGGLHLGQGLREAAARAHRLLECQHSTSYADTIRLLSEWVKSLKECILVNARFAAHAAGTLEAERDKLGEERDALKMNAIEQSEVYAQTVRDLALALGVELSPCSSGCPGHLPAEGVAKLKRLRAVTIDLRDGAS